MKLAKSPKKSASHVARELGVAEKTLLAWLQVSRAADEAKQQRGASEGNRELELMRQKAERLQEEVGILRKATAYFADLEQQG